MSDSKNSIDSILFGKYLAGEASPEEAIQLEDWISISASNKLLFDQFVTTWNKVQPQAGYEVPDKGAAWRKIHQAIVIPQTRPGRLRQLLIRYPVAAVVTGIAILSLIPLIFFTGTDHQETKRRISFTTVGGTRQTTLPDGSSIVLNGNSVISYPEKFRADQREAKLSGEAFFRIVPDPTRPFKVSFDNVDVLVLGTSFNLRKSNDGSIETQVSSGRVKMFNASGEVIISTGETGIYDEGSNSFSLKKDLDLNTFAYATKNFVFSDEELSNIIKYLENAYSKKIILKNNLVGKCKMTSSFSNKTIEYILDVIAATLDLTYTIEEDTIYIGGEHEGC